MPQRDRYVSPTNTYSPPYRTEEVKIEKEPIKNKKVYFIKEKTKKRLKAGNHYVVRVKSKYKNKEFKGVFISLYLGGNNLLILEDEPRKIYNIKEFDFIKKLNLSLFKGEKNV